MAQFSWLVPVGYIKTQHGLDFCHVTKKAARQKQQHQQQSSTRGRKVASASRCCCGSVLPRRCVPQPSQATRVGSCVPPFVALARSSGSCLLGKPIPLPQLFPISIPFPMERVVGVDGTGTDPAAVPVARCVVHQVILIAWAGR